MAVWIYAASWPAWFGLNTLCKSHSLNKKIKIVWAFAGILSASQVACVTEAAGQQGRDRPSFTGAQVESGRQIYVAQCASCHGNELQGGAGPALSGVTFRRGWFEGLRALDEMFDTIYQRMPPSTVDTVSEADALDLIAYVLERNGLDSGAMALNRQALNVRLALGTDAGALAPRAAGATAARDRPSSFPAAPTAFSPARRSVPDDQEILEILDEDWLTAHRDLRGQRFSPLAQITSGNVGRLVPSCLLQLGDSGSFQTSPVAYQGRLYVTTKHKTIAIDAVSCIRLWEHTYVPTDPEPLPGNRGVALYRGKVIRGTTDGHLLALDTETGDVLWDAWVADSRRRYSVPGAPLAIDGKVFVGESGGDFGIDGRIHAFDAETGEPLWSFATIAKDQPGSWPADTNNGGGGSWSFMTFDPEAGLLYAPIGNPFPLFDGSVRPGDNLYTDSIVALDADTGQLAWYAQQVPHDVYDWDTAAAPLLYEHDGRTFVAEASKNGFLYLYEPAADRTVAEVPISRIENHDAPIPAEGLRVCPGIYGGGGAYGPAYDPSSRTLFVSSIDWCQTFFDPALRQRRPVDDPIDDVYGWIRAIDATTGRERWAHRTDTPMVSAVTATAGGVVFGGDLNGYFLALDAETGRELFRFNTGGPIAGGITSYSVQGKQYVAVAAGNVSRGVPWRTRTASPTLVVFTLP